MTTVKLSHAKARTDQQRAHALLNTLSCHNARQQRQRKTLTMSGDVVVFSHSTLNMGRSPSTSVTAWLIIAANQGDSLYQEYIFARIHCCCCSLELVQVLITTMSPLTQHRFPFLSSSRTGSILACLKTSTVSITGPEALKWAFIDLQHENMS